MNETLKRWLRAFIIVFIVFLILSVYLYLRRGYYNIYIINKVFGSAAVVLAGMTLLMGPLSKKFSSLARFMTIRRHLGLLAFGLAVMHIVLSLSQTQRFAWFSWYFNEWIPVGFGILAILIWGYMTYISRNKKIQELGVDLWKNRLSLAGKLGFIAVFLHLTIMKYEGWIRWFTGGVKKSPGLANPEYPPASIFVFIGMLAVILFRIAYSILNKGKEVEKHA